MINDETYDKIYDANYDGDIVTLESMVSTNEFDPLYASEKEEWNFLHRLCMNLRMVPPTETLSFYIEKNVPINAQDMYGMTPLHYAVRSHHLDAVRLLLEAGANPNLQNQEGDHALRQAVLKLPREEDLPIFELLVEHGVDINKPNNNGVTTLDVLRMGTKRPQSILDYLEEAEQKQLNA